MKGLIMFTALLNSPELEMPVSKSLCQDNKLEI